ncbi:hypothetical protein BDV93DRAFT_610684 [Ceratobasidium sp. AG-I]|nr:hypothetical protein BDV93DRAFT_610684 [Ceratobasidium sp. AG-I]
MSSHTPSSRAQSPHSDGFVTPIRLSDTDTTPSPSKWSSPPVSPGLLTSKLALLEAANALSSAAETLAAASQAMSLAAKSLATASGSLAHGNREETYAPYESIQQEYEHADYSRSPSEFEWQAPSYSLRNTESQQDTAVEFTTPVYSGTSINAETPTHATSPIPSEPIQPSTPEEISHPISVAYPEPQSVPGPPSIVNQYQPPEDVSLDAFAQSINNDHEWGAPSHEPARPNESPRGSQGPDATPALAKPVPNPPAPVKNSAMPAKPPRSQPPVPPPPTQSQATTGANIQPNVSTTSTPPTNLRQYLTLKSEFDIIPLLGYLAEQASDNIICFVKSVATVQPLAKMIGTIVSRPVVVDMGSPLSKESTNAIKSSSPCMLIRSAYHALPPEALKKSIGLVIHIGWTGDKAMYERQIAGTGVKSKYVILTESESPKGSKIFNELHEVGVESSSPTEINAFNNQTSFARLASTRDQWKAQLRTAQGSETARTCYMAWIVDHNTGRHKVKNWSAVELVTHANKFAQIVLLRAKSGNVVGGPLSVTAGFVKHMKLDAAVKAGILPVKG